MRTLFKKFMRDNTEARIIRKYKEIYPHFEMDARSLRIPHVPKIIVYSNASALNPFLQNIFPAFKILNPAPSNQTDEEITRSVALDITSLDENEFYNGVLVHGFPFNPSQAFLLDKFLGGVNLAMHIKTNEPVGGYEQLLKYYEEKGALLEVDYKDESSVQDGEEIRKKVIYSLKQSL